MKKVMLILAAACMTVAANAKILRVSNVSGSSAPYSSIEAAHDAASAGDTIMVDASPTRYGNDYTITLTKKVVLIGPGYWLVDNGIMEEGASGATIHGLTIKASETVVKGMIISSSLNIQASKVVVNRCHINGINISKACDNVVISQSYILNKIDGNTSNFHQITNNIFISTSTYSHITGMNNCTIAFNTCRSANFQSNVTNSTFEHNLWKNFENKGSNNSVSDNYETDIINTQATNDFIDKDYYALEIPADVISKYGAFAGNSPYVLAGVPSGPVIQDLIVPTTVEMGSKMNVTVKIGMVK